MSGIMCVLLAAKGSRWNYIIGILNCLTYSWVSYKVGLFGEIIENMAFYLPLQFIGFYMWSKKTMSDGIVEMRKLPLWKIAVGFIGCAGITYGFGLFLDSLEGQVNPFLDSFTNVLTIIAALLMLLRYREYWLVYIIVNSVQVFIWLLRVASGDSDSVTMSVMWFAYLVNSVYGAIVWYQATLQETSNSP